jgi:hypothetical protein
MLKKCEEKIEILSKRFGRKKRKNNLKSKVKTFKDTQSCGVNLEVVYLSVSVLCVLIRII